MMKDTHAKRLVPFSSGVLIRPVIVILSLLACFANSYHLKETTRDVGAATTLNTRNPTKDCSDIHDDLRRHFMSTYQTSDVTTYRIRLKLFTTHKDTLEILAMPAFATVRPIAIFDKDKHRGFTADLSEEQICELYHLPNVTCELYNYDGCRPDTM